MAADRRARERARARLAHLATEPVAARAGPGRPLAAGPAGGWVPPPPHRTSAAGDDGRDQAQVAGGDDRGEDAEPGVRASRDEDVAASIRSRALASALTAYSAAHGHPLDHPAAGTEPVECRWATRGRVAVAAAVVLALLCVAVVSRALSQAPSTVVPRASEQSAPDGGGGAPVDGREAGGPTDSPPAPDVGQQVQSGQQVPAGQGTGEPTASVVVHVVGQVGRPGLVSLPSGSRVDDAITAAGGPVADADLAALNLARIVVDGEQVVVPRPGESAVPTQASTTGTATGQEDQPVDLNTADLADLDALPGIGPVLAQRILDWRTEHGAFTAVEELREVTGIGQAVFEGVRDLVRV